MSKNYFSYKAAFLYSWLGEWKSVAGARPLRFSCWCTLVVWPWDGHFQSQGLSFLICKWKRWAHQPGSPQTALWSSYSPAFLNVLFSFFFLFSLKFPLPSFLFSPFVSPILWPALVSELLTCRHQTIAKCQPACTPNRIYSYWNKLLGVKGSTASGMARSGRSTSPQFSLGSSLCVGFVPGLVSLLTVKVAAIIRGFLPAHYTVPKVRVFLSQHSSRVLRVVLTG